MIDQEHAYRWPQKSWVWCHTWTVIFLLHPFPWKGVTSILRRKSPTYPFWDSLTKRSYRLLSNGHRVGIVNQTETAALKKISDTRNALFERKLTNLFTATTCVRHSLTLLIAFQLTLPSYIEALDSVDQSEESAIPPFMCLIEEPKEKNSADVSLGIITICPSTGDVTYDDFDGVFVVTPVVVS